MMDNLGQRDARQTSRRFRRIVILLQPVFFAYMWHSPPPDTPGWAGPSLFGLSLVTLFTGMGVELPAASAAIRNKFRAGAGRPLTRFYVRGLTEFAAWLAGPKRAPLRGEWSAHLAGESGHDPISRAKLRQALGFSAAAIRFRLQDTADLAWRPIDAVLASRFLSNVFVGGPVIVVLFAIVHHDGRFGLVTDIQDAGELGAFLYGVIRVGRWWRGVKPPEPKARRARD